MHTVDHTTTDHAAAEAGLRRLLLADAAICAVSGIGLVVFRSPIADLVGRDSTTALAAIGTFLAVLAIGLSSLARAHRRTMLRLTPWSAEGDLLWAAASLAVAAVASLNGTGRVLVLIQAVAVAGMGVAKLAGRRRALVS